MTPRNGKPRHPFAGHRGSDTKISICNHNTAEFIREAVNPQQKIDYNKQTLQPAQLAAIKLGQLKKLAKVHSNNGEILDANKWLSVGANILGSSPAAIYQIKKNGRPWNVLFTGLVEDSLTKFSDDCSLKASPKLINKILQSTLRYYHKGGKPMLAATIGDMLGITALSRQEAKAWFFEAMDETPQQRATKLKVRKRDREAARRIAAGATPRSQSMAVTKPWEALGISRRTYFYRIKAGREIGPTAPSNKLTTDSISALTLSPRRV